MLRWVIAPNAGAMTLDGTRTYLVGSRHVAVIDPGPALATHLERIVDELDGASATILLTHDHPDHAEGAGELARRIGAPIFGGAAGGLADGAKIETDAGALVAVHTPGHTPDHFAFLHETEGALFCGDLMMGGLDTALVGAPEGDLSDYLASLDRVRELTPRIIVPAHGPPFEDPAGAIRTYLEHRLVRLAQVRDALRKLGVQDANATADVERLTDRVVEAVYGPNLEPALRSYARAAIDAYLAYLQRT